VSMAIIPAILIFYRQKTEMPNRNRIHYDYIVNLKRRR